MNREIDNLLVRKRGLVHVSKIVRLSARPDSGALYRVEARRGPFPLTGRLRDRAAEELERAARLRWGALRR